MAPSPRMGELAAGGSLADALRAGATFPFSDQEIALVEDAGYFESAAVYVPNLLQAFQQLAAHQGRMADDPEVLVEIKAPVLVLHGAAKPFWVRGARHVADHAPHARVKMIPGAGHAAPLTSPDSLAEALAEFFSPASTSD